jgi:hypothetical protein
MSKKGSANRVQVTFRVGVDMDDLAENIFESLTFDEIHDFIVKLDKACEDWGVTEKLHDYFCAEMEKCPKDEPEEAA